MSDENGKKAVTSLMLDLLGPAAKEVGATLGDHIRYYRWRSAVSIMNRAKGLIRSKGQTISSIPLKFLVPFLEKASLEEEDSRLSELWSNLLASEAAESSSANHAFIDILSKISNMEAKYIASLAKDWIHVGGALVSPMMLAGMNQEAMRKISDVYIRSLSELQRESIEGGFDKFLSEISNEMICAHLQVISVEWPGVLTERFGSTANPNRSYSHEVASFHSRATKYFRANEPSILLLQHLGVLEKREIQVERGQFGATVADLPTKVKNGDFLIEFIQFSELGVGLYNKCVARHSSASP